MKVSIEQDGDVTIVRPQGRIDGVGAQELDSQVAEIRAGQPSHLVIDLADVPFVSSAGLRVFIVTARELRGKAKFAVCNAGSVVKEVFTLAGFDRVMSVCEDLNSAKAL